MAYPKVLVDGREYIPKLAPAIHKDQTLAQYLKMLREEVGLTITDVADITGLRTWSIEAWEKETSTLRFTEAALLARVYGVSLDLFGARIMRVVDEATPGKVTTFEQHDGTVGVVGKELGKGGQAAPTKPPIQQAYNPREPLELDAEAFLAEEAEVEEEAAELPSAAEHFLLDLYVDDSDEYIEEEEWTEGDSSRAEADMRTQDAPKKSVEALSATARLNNLLDEIL